ncbi:PilZ domain-containing protein [Arsukibacterium sp.]|uniref:PilZ domain-containing protein n=1 Tax=Arsukibacterium sp. TaxID=1977258 RepID=UPI002FD8A3F3
MNAELKHAELQALAAEYHDYFSIAHPIVINVRDCAQPLPDEQQFLAQIPAPFLLAGEVTQLNMSGLRALNRLGELAEELAKYLQQQAQKIDLLLHYVLQQQDNQSERQLTLSYGGAGCCFISPQAYDPLSILQIKLFLAENEGAVFCYGQVLSAEQVAAGWQITVVFKRIREQDRELIVRASLHQQSRQLKLKAAERQQQHN